MQQYDDEEGSAPLYPEPDLEYLRRKFREANNASLENREEAQRDADFYHGPKQLDAKLRYKLEQRGQPPIFYNRVSPAIDNTLGVLDNAETTVEVEGTKETSDDAAEVVTDVLRFAAEKAHYKETKRIVSSDVLIYGIGATIVETDRDSMPRSSPVRYDEFFFDPRSRREDFKDAAYLIRAREMDESAVKRLWPAKAAEIQSYITSFGDTCADTSPSANILLWLDPSRRVVRVVELFHIDDASGEWMRTVYCGATVLEHGLTGYVDDTGKHVCPIEAVSFKINEEFQRYGMIRNMRPIQNSINSRASKMLQLTISNRLRTTEQAVPVSAAVARREAAKADGVLPWGYEWGSNSTNFQQHLEILNGDIEHLDKFAPNSAMVGRAGGANTSGRAHQIMANAGFNELSRVFTRFEAWEMRVYRQLWWRCRQFMTDEQIIRITGDAGEKQHLAINVPVIGMVPQPVTGPDGQPIMGPKRQPAMHMVPGVVSTKNELALMDVDLKITTVQDAGNTRKEAWQAILGLVSETGIRLTDPMFQFVLEFAEIPNKAWAIQKWKSLQQAAMQQQQAQAAPQQQMQQVNTAQQIQLTQAKTAQHNAQAAKDQAMAEKHSEEALLLASDHAMRANMLAEAQQRGHSLLDILNNQQSS